MVLDQKIEEGPTPSYDAEATTSGSMEELATSAYVKEVVDSVQSPSSKPIMEVHHSEALVD